VKLATNLKLVPRSRKCGFIYSPIRLHGVVLNSLSTGTTFLVLLFICDTETTERLSLIREVQSLRKQLTSEGVESYLAAEDFFREADAT
jgi:hypothetical protein